jgi:hypothetical protein
MTSEKGDHAATLRPLVRARKPARVDSRAGRVYPAGMQQGGALPAAPAGEAGRVDTAFARLASALDRAQLVAPDALRLGPTVREALHVLGRAPRVASRPQDPARVPILAPFAKLGLFQDIDTAAALLDAPPEVLDALRAGRGLVMIDSGNEGRALNPQHLATLHGLFERHGIPAGRVVWVQQNRSLAERYAAHCAQHGLAPMRIETAHSHAAGLWRRLVQRRGEATHWRLGFAARSGPERRHRWVCLNYKLRPARALVVARLLGSGAPGYLSFSVTRQTPGRRTDRQLLDGAAALWPQDPDGARAEVAGLLAGAVHHGSDLDGFAHPAERIYSLPVEAVAAAELFVVTETEMEGPGLQRLTEKTLKALGSGLPFVVFGNAGVIGGLRDLGFDVFDDLLDHGYDALADPAARFAAAEAATMRFLARPPGFTPGEQARLLAAAAQNEAVFRSRLIEDALLEPMARILALAVA